MNKTYLEYSPRYLEKEIAGFIERLATEDRNELMYSLPKDTVKEFYISSTNIPNFAMRLKRNGRILAIGGVSEYIEGYYGVWLLCSAEACKYPVSLYRYCKEVLSEYKGTFGAWVYKPNINHIKFITKGFGFTSTGKTEGKLELYWGKGLSLPPSPKPSPM